MFVEINTDIIVAGHIIMIMNQGFPPNKDETLNVGPEPVTMDLH